MARTPDVDDLYTRRLETRDLERSAVKACEVEQQAGGTLVLRTRSERYQTVGHGARRRVYLPDGVWTHWWTEESTAGPRWVEVEADLATIPIWLREGAVVPMGPVVDHVGQRPLDTLTLRVAPFSRDGVRELTVPTSGEDLRISYRAVKGRHTLTTSPAFRVELQVVGPDPPPVAHLPA